MAPMSRSSPSATSGRYAAGSASFSPVSLARCPPPASPPPSSSTPRFLSAPLPEVRSPARGTSSSRSPTPCLRRGGRSFPGSRSATTPAWTTPSSRRCDAPPSATSRPSRARTSPSSSPSCFSVSPGSPAACGPWASSSALVPWWRSSAPNRPWSGLLRWESSPSSRSCWAGHRDRYLRSPGEWCSCWFSTRGCPSSTGSRSPWPRPPRSCLSRPRSRSGGRPTGDDGGRSPSSSPCRRPPRSPARLSSCCSRPR